MDFGTPCQIEGFISYLNKEYDNLLCLDFICHGVPSPKVFENYKMEIEGQFGAKINNISFRCKNSGWKSYSVSILLDNNSKYEKQYSQDIYMKGYLQNLYLRPSCYACGFKSINRRSDITIADFWGIECLLPEMDDDKGTSLIIVNSSKGQTVFDAINKKMKASPVDIYKAVHYNTSAIASSGYNINRDKFFSKMSFSKTNISTLVHTYTKIKMYKRIYSILKKVLHKLKCV